MAKKKELPKQQPKQPQLLPRSALEDNRLDNKDSKPLRRGLERSTTETIYNFATKLCPGCKRTRSVAQFVGSTLCRSCNLRNVKV